MSTSDFIPLTEPERDMLAWFRLGPDPDEHLLRSIDSCPDIEESLVLPEAAA